ncbi:alkaline phosphatase, tissue-nonspecific isozyme-like [Adelges cooleyi]|uniref:alkaline phosphatase, tissue-nonspecific isozyme-like n=1 Tax=Adelges cooleyi TaxID=133065 RepID=UPI00217FAA5D|nr:alkaline phosphatase, tissue-nonspecific isozyme-like [Adelges cooleyi]
MVATGCPAAVSPATLLIWVALTACFCLLAVAVDGNVVPVEKTAEHTERDRQYWIENAKDKVTEKLKYINKRGVAKNVIMFLGDGMSVTTLTASRIYQGQLKKLTGESEYLSFEKFPFVGMSKTYCVNKQVSDSACTATAYLTGVKGNYETVGLSAAVELFDCPGSVAQENRTDSILQWAQKAGKSTGVVTTTKVTHASPAGTYAHSAHRNWESDYDLAKAANLTDISQCMDIAKQLVTQEPGKDINVILGGGRNKFFLENSIQNGSRSDVDLVQMWKNDKTNRFMGSSAKYIEDRDSLLNIDPSKTDYLLGLFAKDDMDFHLLANPTKQPTLAEMTKTAIEVLSKNKNGFFLFVEGGLIDLGHHQTKARLALDETVEFSKAVQQAVDMTKEDDTLIVVTSDHSHTMTMAGYPDRGSDILGVATTSSTDAMPYTTLSYANGPGTVNGQALGCARQNLSGVDLTDPTYMYPHLVPLKYETHGGEDVMVFARGPWAHLFTGNYEQNVIPVTMGFAAGIGPAADPSAFKTSGGVSSTNSCTYRVFVLCIASLIATLAHNIR